MSGPAAAALKLVALCALGIALLRVTSVVPLLVVAAALGLGAALARVPAGALWRQLRSVLPVVAAIVLAQGLVVTWQQGGLVGLRILLVVAAAGLVTLTTPVTDMLTVLEWLCRPLRVLGVDPTRVGLTLAMAIRFVPLLGDRLATIRAAQRARGVERPGVGVVSPLLVGTLRMADGLADALDARGLADGALDDGPAALPWDASEEHRDGTTT